MNPFYLPAFRGQSITTISGGPYLSRPSGTFGVKMAVEINAPCNVNVPTADYSTPRMSSLEEGVTKTLRHMAAHPTGKVYVGCMGGIGRTGLFLSVLAKCFGAANPVAYTRENYIPHAVETKAQQEMVRVFEVTREMAVLVFIIKVRTTKWVRIG